MRSLNRIKTLTQYYLWITLKNPAKLFLTLAFCIFDLMIWGYTGLYFQKNQNVNMYFINYFIGAFIFWNLIYRTQQEISNQFMQDIFSKNFSNILITPIRLPEIILSLIISSLLKIFFILAILYISVYVLFFLRFPGINLNFPIFFINLIIFGWILGVITVGFVIRFGLRFDFLNWSLAFFVWPLSCVFYPRNSLPIYLKTLSYFVPSSYIFEIMRKQFTLNDEVKFTELYYPITLNLIFFLLVYLFILLMFKWAKSAGGLTRI